MYGMYTQLQVTAELIVGRCMAYEVVLRSQGANSGYAGRNIEARQDGLSYTKSGNTKSQLLIWYTNRCFQHTYDQKIVRWTNVTSAAVVRFSPVQRGFHENQEPNLGPVLPDSTNPERDRSERFGTVRFGFFLVRT
jgi:hypothetical protein